MRTIIVKVDMAYADIHFDDAVFNSFQEAWDYSGMVMELTSTHLIQRESTLPDGTEVWLMSRD